MSEREKWTEGPWEVLLPENWPYSASAEASIYATKSTNPVVAHVSQRLADERDLSHNARLIAQAPAMYEMLERLEWCQFYNGYITCPLCRGRKSHRHEPDCSLDALLTAANPSR